MALAGEYPDKKPAELSPMRHKGVTALLRRGFFELSGSTDDLEKLKGFP